MKTSFPLLCLLIFTLLLFSCASDQQTISDSPILVTPDTIPIKKHSENIVAVAPVKIIDQKKNKVSQVSKTTLYRQLQSPFQNFRVSGLKDTILTGNQGTKLDIRKNSFLLNGQPYNGSVFLHLKECYSYEDMILNNLSTLSNDRLLESGGMICLEAFTNDHQKLTLDRNQPIGLQMPSEAPKQYMQLFYADNTMNWIQASDSKPQFAAISNNRKNNSPDLRTGNYFIMNNGFGTVITTVNLLKDGKEIQLSSTSYANRSLYLEYMDSLSLYFEMDANGYIYNSKIRDTGTDRNIKITPYKLISMNDATMNYSVYTPRSMGNDCNLLLLGAYPYARNTFELSFIVPRTIYTTVKRNANRAGRSKVIVRNTYVFRSNGLSRRQERIKEIQANLDSSQGSVKEVSVQDLEYYAFSINRLGWINCDRFYTVPASQKTNFTVVNQEGVDLKLVFSDMKAVLTGYSVDGKTIFTNVPKNKDVTLVGIRIVNDKAELATLKTTTQEICQEPLVYTPVSVEELKERIKTML